MVQCESNFLGILGSGKNVCIGSGGWANIIEKFRKAKSFCDRPFEVRYRGRKKEIVPIENEWIGDNPNGKRTDDGRVVQLRCDNAALVLVSK